MENIGFHNSSGTEEPLERFNKYRHWSNVVQFFSQDPKKAQLKPLDKFQSLFIDTDWVPVLHGR